MLKIAIIVFREILEIALVIGILLAATKGIKKRNFYILSGLGLGVMGSILIAFFTDNISNLFQGAGQEAFNASILLISSAMIAWTVIWVKKYSKTIANDLKNLGNSVATGNKSLFALMPVVALAVLREGTEIVLFSYGSFVSGDKISSLVLGGIFGLTAGIAVGLGLYFGLLRFLGRHFFSVTSYLLIFLAAGMVSHSLGFLAQGGFVPEIIYPVWDSSSFLLERSFIGSIFHAMFGYVSKPSAIQLIGYVGTLALLFLGIRKVK
jgi:high-affinity iron transporter